MPVPPLELVIESSTGRRNRLFQTGSVAGARYSARDVEATRRKLDERIACDGHYTGATRTNPSIFRIGRYLLTQDEVFDVQGPLTGCEAEVVAVREQGEIFITVGSDQCDRELDPLFPDKPKQMCPHPIASTAWPYEEVRDHWDQLQVYSQVVVQGQTVVIQDTSMDCLVDLEHLLAMEIIQLLPEPAVLYCGAAPFLKGAIAEVIEKYDLPPETAHGTGDQTLVRLHDPVLDRTIQHQFTAVPVGDDLAERNLTPIDGKPA